MASKNKNHKLINECNQIFNLYKEISLEVDQISKRINILQYLYEHEIKINNFYHNYTKVSKSSTDIESFEVKYTDLYILENNELTNELTKEQRLKIHTNRNAAMILRLEKQLNKVNVDLDEAKVNFIRAYKIHLLRKHNY